MMSWFAGATNEQCDSNREREMRKYLMVGLGLLGLAMGGAQAQEIKPAVRLLGSGVIIPGSEQVMLPFKAVNLKAVDVKVVKIFENNITQFLQINQLGGSRELKRAGRLILKKQVA